MTGDWNLFHCNHVSLLLLGFWLPTPALPVVAIERLAGIVANTMCTPTVQFTAVRLFPLNQSCCMNWALIFISKDHWSVVRKSRLCSVWKLHFQTAILSIHYQELKHLGLFNMRKSLLSYSPVLLTTEIMDLPDSIWEQINMIYGNSEETHSAT